MARPFRPREEVAGRTLHRALGVAFAEPRPHESRVVSSRPDFSASSLQTFSYPPESNELIRDTPATTAQPSWPGGDHRHGADSARWAMSQTVEMSRVADLDAVVREAQRGETAAFEAIYRRFAARVHTLCLRLCADGCRAEELTQDIFVRTWRKIDTFRWESSFETWLYRVAVNQALTALRSHRRRASWELLTDDPGAAAGLSRQAHPGRALDLEKAIAALPPGARTVFVLHDVEGYRHAEIAKLMGLAEGTCKAQLHRARRLLRETLTR